MNKEELVNLVEYLHSASKEGYRIVTWNGLGKVYLNAPETPIFSYFIHFIQ